RSAARATGQLVRVFFAAGAGIRDFHVTGVQTCALPICKYTVNDKPVWYYNQRNGNRMPAYHRMDIGFTYEPPARGKLVSTWDFRSEERRVGKEGGRRATAATERQKTPGGRCEVSARPSK